MGSASAGPIFDSTAIALIEEEASEHLKRRVLGTLIKTLQDGDWDTEDESLGDFRDDLVIVSLFYEHGVGNRFDDWPEGTLGFDTESRMWTLTCRRCGGVIKSAPFTVEGHDQLVHRWPEHVVLGHKGEAEVDTWKLLNR